MLPTEYSLGCWWWTQASCPTPSQAEVADVQPVPATSQPEGHSWAKVTALQGQPHPVTSVQGLSKPSHFPQLGPPSGHLGQGLCQIHVTAKSLCPVLRPKGVTH